MTTTNDKKWTWHGYFTNNELDADNLLTTETLTTDNISCLLPGFYCYFLEDVNPLRGRPMECLSICVSKSLDCKSIEIYRKENMLCVSVNLPTIAVCYNPPNTSVEDIILDFWQFQTVGGDFSYRLDGDNVRGEILCENLHAAGLHCISSPENRTYYSHNGSSTVDLFFTKNITASTPTTQQIIQTKHQIFSCRIVFHVGKVDKTKQNALRFNPNAHKQNQLSCIRTCQIQTIAILISSKLATTSRNRSRKDIQSHGSTGAATKRTNTDESSLESYSQAKRSYQALCRQKRTSFERDREETIIFTAEADRSKFWSISSSKKSSTMPSQVQQDMWITHFEKLFQGEKDVSFPEDQDLYDYYNLLDRPISLPEVAQAIARQANN